MVSKREILSLSRHNQQSEAQAKDRDLSIDRSHEQETKVPVKSDPILEPSKMHTKNSDTIKSNSAEKVALNSLSEILTDIYTIAFKKDGKPKPLKVGREHEVALKKLERAELSDNKFNDKLIVTIAKLDPTYKYLLGLVVLSSGAQARVRRALIEFAVLAISRNWVGRHSGCDNIFEEYARPTDISNEDVIAVICRNIKDYFEKQLKQRTKPVSQTSDKEIQSEASYTVSTSNIKKKAQNVLAIGCLWGLETGKCSAEKAIAQMQKIIQSNDTDPVNEVSEACYAFASSIKEPINEFIIAIRYFKQKLEISEERRKHAENISLQKEANLTSNRSKLNDLESTILAKDAEIKALEIELKNLKGESYERQLSEQATRVHLRDDAGKAKSKAYNLISEDIEPAVQLSLKALMREKPKVEVAIHQLELALESIEENLPWFK
jgi:hypothetical protein